MNENENTTPGSAPAPEEAAPDTSRSAVFSAIRSIFGHGSAESAAAPDAPAPADVPVPAPAPAGPPARVVIRNCSTRRVLALLVQQFGGGETVSGRYFAPAVSDVAKIRAWASENSLFVKESRVLDTLVLDLMMDRTKLERPHHRFGGPRFGGGYRDDDGPDEF